MSQQPLLAVVFAVFFLCVPLRFAVCDFEYTEFTHISDLSLVGTAEHTGESIMLTRSGAYQAGAVWYRHRQHVSVPWVTTFTFRIDKPARIGADGIVFIVQNQHPEVLGASGGNIGYGHIEGWEEQHDWEDPEDNEHGAIKNCVAVEFDMFYNQENGDPDGNQISVHTNGRRYNNQDHSYSLGETSDIPLMSDGAIHTARITYDGRELSVFLDDLETPALTVRCNLRRTLQLGFGQAWVGFAAATGGSFQDQEILSWEFHRPALMRSRVAGGYQLPIAFPGAGFNQVLRPWLGSEASILGTAGAVDVFPGGGSLHALHVLRQPLYASAAINLMARNYDGAVNLWTGEASAGLGLGGVLGGFSQMYGGFRLGVQYLRLGEYWASHAPYLWEGLQDLGPTVVLEWGWDFFLGRRVTFTTRVEYASTFYNHKGIFLYPTYFGTLSAGIGFGVVYDVPSRKTPSRREREE